MATFEENIIGTVNTIVDHAITVADDKSLLSDDYATRAIENAQTYPHITSPTVILPPSVVDPGVFIPTNIDGANEALFNSTYDKLVGDIETKLAAFFATYFPNQSDYFAAAQAWLYDVIHNGKTGIPVDIERQIWERDRDRVLRDAERQVDTEIATWAAKGYALPPGAATNAAFRVRMDAQEKVAEASRSTAIKQAEMTLETVKFAVEQALRFRLGAIQAAADYIRAVMLAPEIASRLALSKVEAQARLISAASEYYRARVDVARLQLEGRRINTDYQLETAKANLGAFTESIRSQVMAAVAAAQSAGTQASAALNAVHAGANLGANASV